MYMYAVLPSNRDYLATIHFRNVHSHGNAPNTRCLLYFGIYVYILLGECLQMIEQKHLVSVLKVKTMHTVPAVDTVQHIQQLECIIQCS